MGERALSCFAKGYLPEYEPRDASTVVDIGGELRVSTFLSNGLYSPTEWTRFLRKMAETTSPTAPGRAHPDFKTKDDPKSAVCLLSEVRHQYLVAEEPVFPEAQLFVG